MELSLFQMRCVLGLQTADIPFLSQNPQMHLGGQAKPQHILAQDYLDQTTCAVFGGEVQMRVFEPACFRWPNPPPGRSDLREAHPGAAASAHAHSPWPPKNLGKDLGTKNGQEGNSSSGWPAKSTFCFCVCGTNIKNQKKSWKLVETATKTN